MAIFKNPKVDATDATAPERCVLHDHADLGGLRATGCKNLDEAAPPPVSMAGVDAPLIGRHVRACGAIPSRAGDAGYSEAVGDQTTGAVSFGRKRLPAREKCDQGPEAGQHIVYVECQGEIPVSANMPTRGRSGHRACLGEPVSADVSSISGDPRFANAETTGALSFEQERTMTMIYSGTSPAASATLITKSAPGQGIRFCGHVRIAR